MSRGWDNAVVLYPGPANSASRRRCAEEKAVLSSTSEILTFWSKPGWIRGVLFLPLSPSGSLKSAGGPDGIRTRDLGLDRAAC